MCLDYSEMLDRCCQEMYGHTHWVYIDTMDKEEKKKFQNGLGFRYADNVFFFEIDDRDE